MELETRDSRHHGCTKGQSVTVSTVKLWDTWSGQERQTFTGHSNAVTAVAFSPGGFIVASASRDETVKLWDTRSGQEWQTLTGHSDDVIAVAFSPDGTVVASASYYKIVKLWDTRERQTLTGHSDVVPLWYQHPGTKPSSFGARCWDKSGRRSNSVHPFESFASPAVKIPYSRIGESSM